MNAEDSLEELRELAASAGAQVVGADAQRGHEPDPATLVGRGKVQQILAGASALGAEVVIFDHDLTPTQLRNLEQALDLKVLDRTQLILDIFAARARSREGQLQVELAQLNYLLPRLGGRGTLLSRLGGGIGTRGPGEQQLEFDRRRIRARIRKLEEGIERVRSERSLHRERRKARRFLIVALVGYTNAGKSTLFNALTRSNVAASAKVFATLDPTVRQLPLESRRAALLSDTVGFIRKLPAHLVSAFQATLEELEAADLLLQVTDAADPRHSRQDAAVESLLESLGLAARPRLKVWNKVDLLDCQGMMRPALGPGEVAVSALSGEGMESLSRRIDEALVADPVVEADFDLSLDDGKRLALLYRQGTVVSTRVEENRLRVHARVAESLRDRFRDALVSVPEKEP
ncbi:MAG: GTPase HflX [Acidobacteria bacterium]|nr:MAG: GTPase HflX [Acidobacteriota bacterium]